METSGLPGLRSVNPRVSPDRDTTGEAPAVRPGRSSSDAYPAQHNPLGWVLDRERRARVVEIARAAGCLIVEDGTVTRLEEARRRDAAARQGIARAALGGMDAVAHPGSYIVWLGLEPHQRPDHVAAVLAQEGILVSTADAFATGAWSPPAIRLALATPLLDDLGPALRRLRSAIEAIPP